MSIVSRSIGEFCPLDQSSQATTGMGEAAPKTPPRPVPDHFRSADAGLEVP